MDQLVAPTITHESCAVASLKFRIYDYLVFQTIHHNLVFNIMNTHVKNLPSKKANFGIPIVTLIL